MSRKPPWLRERIRKRNTDRSSRIPKGMLLKDGRNLTQAPDTDPVESHKVSRNGWMEQHPRFHDPLHPIRRKPVFRPWYGNHNEHKPKS